MRRSRININRVSVVGLGKLGFSMAVAFAKRGFRVSGMDVNEHVLRRIRSGVSPVDETDTRKLLIRHRSRIRVCATVAEAMADSDIIFVIVATPSRRDGAFSDTQLIEAMEAIGPALRARQDYPVIAVTCTVMPGTIERAVKPLLERLSGRTCGRDFGLAYNPEFIALGSVVRDVLNPDFVLVGECDARAGATLERFYHRACENRPAVVRMKPIEAEIAKISLNCFCTTKIAFANMLAEIAERSPGADAGVIANAIGLDKRIGRRYLAPGLGFGGPCFPRDNVAFRVFAERLGVKAPIPAAVHASNQTQPRRVVARVRRILPSGGRVAVLGLSYKPQTSVTTESQAMDIVSALARDRRYSVQVYDPMATENARKVLGNAVGYAGSIAVCLRGADVCILAVPWPTFVTISAATFIGNMRAPRVLDCWQCLSPATRRRLAGYMAVGLGDAALRRPLPAR